MRKTLLAGVSLGVLMAGAAQAQVQTGPGFFGYLDGMYILPGKTGVSEAFNLGGKAGRGNGWGIDGKLGYRFDGAFDLALGGRYFDRNKGKGAGVFDWHGTKNTYWNVDGEVGYNITGPGYGVRPFIGVRYQQWRSSFSDSVAPLFGYGSYSWGIGPKIGVDGSLRLTDIVSLFGGVDTSFLYSKTKGSTSVPPGGALNSKRLVWDIGARIGIDVEVAPLVHLGVGYKLEWFDGVNHALAQGGGGPKGRSGELVHGPFVRLAYNWGAPPPGVAAPPVTPPGQVRSFIVFFDFDRSNLTPTAVNTIKQAADQAKAGRTTRIDVTGHTDRAGTDAYNMALSLRRANAVKDQLVRNGIPATQIVVVGRGESQPLVPTADGVREPQNRRVEIVLN